MTRTTPWRWITLHLSQSFFTEALTFMSCTHFRAGRLPPSSVTRFRRPSGISSAVADPFALLRIAKHTSYGVLPTNSAIAQQAALVFPDLDHEVTVKLPRDRRGGFSRNSFRERPTRVRGQYPFYYPTLRAQLHVAKVLTPLPSTIPALGLPPRRVVDLVARLLSQSVDRVPCLLSQTVRNSCRPGRGMLPALPIFA